MTGPLMVLGSYRNYIVSSIYIELTQHSMERCIRAAWRRGSNLIQGKTFFCPGILRLIQKYGGNLVTYQ